MRPWGPQGEHCHANQPSIHGHVLAAASGYRVSLDGLRAPRRTFGDREQPVGLFVMDEVFGLRIPFQRPCHLLDHAAQQQGAGRAMGDVGVADGALAGADALQEVARVAVGSVEPRLARAGAAHARCLPGRTTGCHGQP